MAYLFLFGFLVLTFSYVVALPPCTFNEVTVRPVTTPVQIGDNPHWCHRHQVLYFGDVFEHAVYRFDPLANTLSSVFVEGGPLSVIITTQNDNQLLVSRGRDIVVFSWDGFSPRGPLTILASVDGDKPNNRFNDGIADENGRLWIGTNSKMKPWHLPAPHQGNLYSFTIDNGYQPEVQIPGITFGSGIGWNKKNTLMFYTFLESRRIAAIDYDQGRGKLGNGRTAFDLNHYDIPGYPNGFAVDEKDLLWVAIFNGSRIIQVNPLNGKLLRTIPLPVKEVVNCAFGGPDLSTLYVTTARKFLEPGQMPLSGALYAIDGLGVRGQRKSNIAVVPFQNYESQSGWKLE